MSDNPVDMTMEITVNARVVGQVAEKVREDDEVDALIVLITKNADPPAFDVARGVVKAARSSTDPVIVARLAAQFLAPPRSLTVGTRASRS